MNTAVLPSATEEGGDAGASPPVHVAVIMDGNGRWARRRGLPRTEGHRQGVTAVRTTIEAAVDHGVRYLTLYAFSTENWNRPASEINALMSLLLRRIRKESEWALQQGVRVRFIGERARLEPGIVRAMEETEELTAANDSIVVLVGVDYGGRAELVAAAKKLVQAAREEGLGTHDIDEARLDSCLMTAGVPDPDLVIRTGGEQRLSNFLLWQVAYAELHFSPVLWPDFHAEDFRHAVRDYRGRRRRRGRVDEALPTN